MQYLLLSHNPLLRFLLCFSNQLKSETVRIVIVFERVRVGDKFSIILLQDVQV
jgi:hypothetical protein